MARHIIYFLFASIVIIDSGEGSICGGCPNPYRILTQKLPAPIFLTVSNIPLTEPEITLSLWFKLTPGDDAQQIVYYRHIDNRTSLDVYYDGNVRIVAKINKLYSWVHDTVKWAWHLLTITSNTSRIEIYIDETLIGYTFFGVSKLIRGISSGGKLGVGSRCDGPNSCSHYFLGALDTMEVLHKYLRLKEVKDLANCNICPPNKLQSSYTGGSGYARISDRPTCCEEYRMLFKTSNKLNAGTDGSVRATIYGSAGETNHFLVTPPGDPFEQGDTDTYTIYVKNLGNLQALYIDHTKEGNAPAWHLSNVGIYSTNKAWVFDADRQINGGSINITESSCFKGCETSTTTLISTTSMTLSTTLPMKAESSSATSMSVVSTLENVTSTTGNQEVTPNLTLPANLSQIGKYEDSNSNKGIEIEIAIPIAITGLLLAAAIVGCLYVRRRNRDRPEETYQRYSSVSKEWNLVRSGSNKKEEPRVLLSHITDKVNHSEYEDVKEERPVAHNLYEDVKEIDDDEVKYDVAHNVNIKDTSNEGVEYANTENYKDEEVEIHINPNKPSTTTGEMYSAVIKPENKSIKNRPINNRNEYASLSLKDKKHLGRKISEDEVEVYDELQHPNHNMNKTLDPK